MGQLKAEYERMGDKLEQEQTALLNLRWVLLCALGIPARPCCRSC